MTQQTNEALIRKFYEAFSRLDYATMQQCYHAEAVFNDEAFVNLNAAEVKAMWEMLCKNAKDFSLQFDGISANNTQGSCRWVAHYTFSRTQRKVVNHVGASFEFKDGLIYRHTDRFGFAKWAAQALGLPGLLLGNFPFFKAKVRRQARLGLQKFMNR